MRSVLQDLRYGLRSLLHKKGYTVVAVLTLALAIGANAAIFSYTDATWLRPLPVPSTNRLVKVFTERRTSSGVQVRGDSSYQDYLDIRAQSTTLEDVVAFEQRGALLHHNSEVIQLPVNTVSPNFFIALGTPALVGRVFGEHDFTGGFYPVVISHDLWQRVFAGDPTIINQQIRLTNGLVTVIGIMPRNFRGLDLASAPAVWIPAPTWTYMVGDTFTFSMRGSRRQQIVARLKSGVRLTGAQAELSTIAARLAQTYSDSDRDLRLNVEREADTRDEPARRQGWMLMAISGMLLLIGSVNVAGLQLSSAEARRREFAVRLAMGGSRARLVQQVFCESALLTLIGTAFALLLAKWTITLLPRLFGTGTSLGYDFRVDARVVFFALTACVVSVLISAIAPAWHATRLNLISAIKGETIVATNRHERRFTVRDFLVAGQVALSVILLVCAGLLVRTLFAAQSVDAGFDARQNLLLVDVVPGLAGYDGASQVQSYYRRLIQTMNSLPGVTKAALAVRVPFGRSGGGAQLDVAVPGAPLPPGQRGTPVNFTSVSTDYFATIGTRLLQGRTIDDQDNLGAPRVVVVNLTMARRFWSDGNGVGKTLRVVTPARATDFSVIGVVEDAKWAELTEQPRPIMYLSLWQQPDSEATLLLKTSGNPAALVGAVRRELLRIDQSVPMLSSISLRDHVASTLTSERTRALLSGAFGLMGLTLAAAGIYGVLSYFISRRTHEIGVRMALGADKSNIISWILWRGMRLVLAGITVGVGGAFVLSRYLEGLLFGVKPADPLSVTAVIAVVSGVATVAILLPALRASSIDPMNALREQQ